LDKELIKSPEEKGLNVIFKKKPVGKPKKVGSALSKIEENA